MKQQQDKYDILKTYYGYDTFRDGQEELIDCLLNGQDVCGIMPTGAGKSVCYQVPALLLPHVTLVISPLISLMKDQVRALNQMGVHAAYLNSSLSWNQYKKALAYAKEGRYKIIYVAPERLLTEDFLDFAASTPISLLAVDEAHCVSQWGQDFRPSYLKIPEFVRTLPIRPVIGAFTATATREVREDIIRMLELSDPHVAVTGFDRKNLYFEVRHDKDKYRSIRDYLLAHPDSSGVIYCATRKNVEEVCDRLLADGFRATRYHAGLSDEERRANQEAFTYDDAPIMVATNAFGMGIDKSNVRYVIHHNMPGSLEAYYQEAGRAGRDGESSECLLLWNDSDIGTCRFFIEQEVENEALAPEERELVRASQRRLLAAMTGYCLTTRCLRGHILDYFGDESAMECGNCSNCEGQYQALDVTLQARAVMRCVQELRGRFGKSVVADVLHGSKSQRIFEFGLESSRTYGTLPDDSATRIKEIIEILASEGYLQIGEGRYPLVGLGARVREAAVPEFSLAMKRPPERITRLKGAEGASAAFGAAGSDAPKKAKAAEGLDPMDAELFERLRALRKRIATEATVPPYVVFSDAALRAMCLARPKDEAQFLDVQGVGQKKLERYGEEFLREINA